MSKYNTKDWRRIKINALMRERDEDSMARLDKKNKSMKNVQDTTKLASSSYKVLTALDKINSAKAIDTNLVSNFPDYFEYSQGSNSTLSEGGFVKDFLVDSTRNPLERIGVKQDKIKELSNAYNYLKKKTTFNKISNLDDKTLSKFYESKISPKLQGSNMEEYSHAFFKENPSKIKDLMYNEYGVKDFAIDENMEAILKDENISNIFKDKNAMRVLKGDMGDNPIRDIMSKKFLQSGNFEGLNLPQILGTAQSVGRILDGGSSTSDKLHSGINLAGSLGLLGGYGVPILAVNYLWDMFD